MEDLDLVEYPPGDSQQAAKMCVTRGVAALDAYMPDWRSKIDVRTLNLSSATECVLGQVFATAHAEHVAYVRRDGSYYRFRNGYWYGISVLMIADPLVDASTLTEAVELCQTGWSAEHGFVGHEHVSVSDDADPVYVGYNELRDEWRAVLAS